MNPMKIIHLPLVLGMMALAACHPEKKQENAKAEIPVVEATPVKSLQPAMQTVLPGELKPWNKAHMFPRVKGYVGRVLADRGTVVKKGDVLALLEAPEIVSALNHAKAQVAAAEASLIEQRAKARASTLTYQRMTETNRTKGAVSANEMDMAFSRMSADSALATAAQNNLLAAQAQHASQAQLVNYLTVRAPFDGTVTERNISPGELVGPDGTTKPMFVLEDHEKLRLTVAVPENLSNSISDKAAVSFTVQADPQRTYEARFARSANSLAENNRTMMTEFDVDNRGGALKAGMYAQVSLPVMRNRPTLFVPRTALVQSTEGVFVIRLNEQVAEWLAVQKGNALDSLIEVFGPLHDGETVVLKANEELRNGQAVTVKSGNLSAKK